MKRTLILPFATKPASSSALISSGSLKMTRDILKPWRRDLREGPQVSARLRRRFMRTPTPWRTYMSPILFALDLSSADQEGACSHKKGESISQNNFYFAWAERARVLQNVS